MPSVASKAAAPHMKRVGAAPLHDSKDATRHVTQQDSGFMEGQVLHRGARDTHVHAAVRQSMTRAERKLQTGIECADTVHFTGWEPCNEYTLVFTAKNSTTRTLKLRYRLPQSKVFFLDYPETRVLSAGMSCSFPITFRPIAPAVYRDSVEFTSSLGKFSIPLLATLPEHRLDFSSKLDFGLCAIHEPSAQSFPLKNAGELRTAFRWEVPENSPFSVEPAAGELEPGERATIVVTYRPTLASAHHVQLVCRYGETHSPITQSLELHGVGKFAKLHLARAADPEHPVSEMDLGSVDMGAKKKVALKVVNPSMVKASYTLRQLSTSLAEANACAVTLSRVRGVLDPGASHDIFAVLAPTVPGSTIAEPWELLSPGMSTPIRILFRAQVSSACIRSSLSVVAFGDLRVGADQTRALQIINEGTTPATIQFQGLEGTSAFYLEACNAALVGPHPSTPSLRPVMVVSPGSSVAMSITFRPGAPIVYHRRIHCLVENGSDFTIDVVGTGFTERQRPPSLLPRHLDHFQHLQSVGLGLYGPEQLDQMINLGTLTEGDDGRLHWSDSADTSTIAATAHTPVAMDVDTVDFGTCARYRFIEPRIVTVTNHSHTKVVCVWHDAKTSHFLVEPSLQEIAPQGTTQFRVSYRPEVDDAVDHAQLECFVFPKVMRNFRLITHDQAIMPSFHLPLSVVGNTLSPQMALASVEISAGSRIELPPTAASGPAVSRTFRLVNTGDCPAQFSFHHLVPGGRTAASTIAATSSQEGDTDGMPWSLSPSAGLIPVGGSQLVRATFDPSRADELEAGFLSHGLLCAFNGSIASGQKLQLCVRVIRPLISVRPSAALMVAPTLVGMVGRRVGTLRSESDLPIRFAWRVPNAYTNVLAVSPDSGELPPHGTCEFELSFRPTQAGKSLFHIPLACRLADCGERGAAGTEETRMTVAVGAAAFVGTIQPASQRVHLPHVLINTAHITTAKDVLIENPTECAVHYAVRLRELDLQSNTYGPPAPNNRILDAFGRVPAKSSRPIMLHLFLRQQREYHFKVQIALGRHSSGELDAVPEDQWTDFCAVVASGTFPTLEILHVCGNDLSSTELYRSCNIESVNKALQRGSSKRVLDVVLGARLLGCPDTRVQWVLRNSGPVDLQWSLTSPQDPVVAQEQEASNMLNESRTFTISHRSGYLRPGELQKLTIECAHRAIGLHEQAVQLQVKGGPECDGVIPLLLSATTVQHHQGYLFHAGDNLTFGDVELDRDEPLVAPMPLANNSDVTVWYSVATDELDKTQDENHGFRIFDCLKPHGSIAPGESVAVPFTFYPIEAKAHESTVRVSMVGGQAFEVTISGRGQLPSPGALVARSGSKPSTERPSGDAAELVLDQEEIYLVALPVHALQTRVVVLRNPSTAPMCFLWRSLAHHEEQVRIIPPAGSLEPGQMLVARVYIRGGAAPGRSTHLFECLYGPNMQALQSEVAQKSKRLATSAASSYRTSSSLNRYSTALPSIHGGSGGGRAGSPLRGAGGGPSKRELAVRIETTAQVAGLAANVVPRYVPTALPPSASVDSSAGASSVPAAAAAAVDTAEMVAAIGSTLRACLDAVFQETQDEDVLDKVHGHAEWHVPDQHAPPQDLMQDVLEGVLFGVLQGLTAGQKP
ncbi:hypothetical protein H9P43_001658 [Blastocladiella emersonii ATCC 22665]|nr:hypothetical protein H9P43_001658 [Blastocladiella emersonii ATCC 22665]